MRNLKQHFNVIEGEVTVHVSFIEALDAVKTLLDGNFDTVDEIQYVTGVTAQRAQEIKEKLDYLRWVLAD